MKNNIYIPLFLIFAFTACQYGKPEYVDFLPSKSSKVMAFTPTWEGISNVEEIAPWEPYLGEDESIDDMLSENAPARATSTDIISVVRGIVDMFTCKNIHQVAGNYMSVDVNGKPIMLSGKVFYPENKDIKAVILVSHFTIGANFEAPSQTFSLEGLLATKGYLVIVPDYIGYGITADHVHPYLQADLTAHNVIDMALAVAPWMKERGIKVQSNDRDIILFGYSQGGATTMHVQRMMEEDAEYFDDNFEPMFHIVKTFCGAGPYDVAKTYDYSVKVDNTGIPCAVPMIIQGVSQGMTKPLDLAYFFKDKLYRNYDEWINSKKYTVKQINLLINAKRLSEILTEEGRNKSNEDTQRLYRELGKHSVNMFYIPKAPMFMYHSMDDVTVPFINSQEMKLQFDAANCTQIEYDFGHYGDHTKAMMKFLLKCMKQL